MNKINYKSLVYISLFFYLLCLIFPAFYIDETRNPNYGASLLMIGWLGPIAGHLSWYANPCYVLALIFFKRDTSFVFLILAIALTVSFLTKDTIPRDEGGGTSAITAYGAGYLFWLLSGIMLLLAKIFYDYPAHPKEVIVTAAIPFLALLSVFIYHFAFSENAQLKLELERNRILKIECEKSISKIYKTKNGVKSIFFETIYADRYTKEINGRWRVDGSGISEPSIGLEYYETINDMHRPDHSTKKYEKIVGGSWKTWTGEPEDIITSEVSVYVKALNIPKKYRITGYTETIIDNQNSSTLAKTTYIFEPISGTLCSDQKNDRTFRITDFLKKVINVKK